MALNLNRLLPAGRMVTSLVRSVQRASSHRGRTPGGPHPGRAAGVGPAGEVLDYPGDFHGRATVEYDP